MKAAFSFLQHPSGLVLSGNHRIFARMEQPDLKIFFSPLPESAHAGITAPDALVKSIRLHAETFPDLEQADLALIGLTENRGSGDNGGVGAAADAIREKLYRLKRCPTGTLRIIDLGNLINGHDLEETYLRIREVCSMLIGNNVLPILLGGSHDLSFGQYQAYEDLEKLVSVVHVDAKLDLEDAADMPANSRHVHSLLVHEPNFLFNYSLLGYQSYLVDPAAMAMLERLYFEAHRLGALRRDIREAEPLVREADLLSFDVTAIKATDAPGNAQAQPFGLSGEEACQLCWYAGLNEKLSSIGFYEYNPALDDARKTTASVVATMVWYFIEGYYNRKQEKSFASNDYQRFIVTMPSEPSTLTFYKSRRSEKWWMEVPHPNDDLSRYGRNFMVPCSYNDYLMAVQGEVPERWINTYNKLV